MSNDIQNPLDFALGIANAVISSSDAPLVLLSGDLTVMAASRTFCGAFQIEGAVGQRLATLGDGEWDVPQLSGLLLAAASGPVAVEDYEMDLVRPGREVQHLLINAHKLDAIGDARVMVLLSISDVTDSRARDRRHDNLVREKALLLEELQHRVANSLQIIASVLLQSARRIQSDESRSHIFDAHNRVMSVAALQHQLALSSAETVALQLYFNNLCRSIGASMIRDRDRMRINVDVDGSFVPAALSLNLGLMVTELVINSLKHGYPDDRIGVITVRFRSENTDWTLSVRDDGVGMPVAEGGVRAGLGSSIVKALAVQCDAEIVVTDAKPGTLVTVRHRQPVEVLPGLAPLLV